MLNISISFIFLYISIIQYYILYNIIRLLQYIKTFNYDIKEIKKIICDYLESSSKKSFSEESSSDDFSIIDNSANLLEEYGNDKILNKKDKIIHELINDYHITDYYLKSNNPYIVILFEECGFICILNGHTYSKFNFFINMMSSGMKTSFEEISNRQFIYTIPSEIYLSLDKKSIKVFIALFDISNYNDEQEIVFKRQYIEENKLKSIKEEILTLYDYFCIDKPSFLEI